MPTADLLKRTIANLAFNQLANGSEQLPADASVEVVLRSPSVLAIRVRRGETLRHFTIIVKETT